MANGKTTRRTSSPDIKTLAAELGVPVKEGKVTAVRGSYFITVGRTRKQIPVGEMIDAAQIKSLVGKTVLVVISGSSIVAIGGLTWRPPIIVCYIPAPDIIKRIRPELQETLIRSFVARKVIPAKAAESLLAMRS